MDDLLREFLAETGEHLEAVDSELVRLERDPDDRDILRNVFRLVHTIKGTCGFLGLPRLGALAHAAETLMGRFRGGASPDAASVALILSAIDRIKTVIETLDRHGTEPAGADADLIGALERAAELAENAAAPPDSPSAQRREQPGTSTRPLLADGGPRVPTVRVGIDLLEHLMSAVSELVLVRHRLADAFRQTGRDAGLEAPLHRLSQITATLQDGIVRTRMQPVASAWTRLPRLVRDLSAELGKPIELVLRGGETELDRQVIEIIRDPLTHLVRNAAAHGIEPAAARRLAGKPERGTIRLEARQDGGAITIAVSDDGAGLDLDAIRRRAVATGLAGEAEMARAGDAEAIELIFRPGFSTAAAIDSVSGRGVGMDVVRANVGQVGGQVDVRTERGRGATFMIRIPLTLSLVPALIVGTAGHRFALPQVSIVEIVPIRTGPDRPGPARPGVEPAPETPGEAPLLRVRDGNLPIVDLEAALGLDPEPGGGRHGFVVVAEIGGAEIGIRVERVLETEEVVVKPLARGLRHLHAFSGNTILGDGSVILVVDPEGLVRTAGPTLLRDAPRRAVHEAAEPDDTLALLVFRDGTPVLKAVPLALILRLEEVDASRIEWAGGRATVPYRGAPMPVVPADGALRIRDAGPQPIVVFSDGTLTMGLAVREIVDVVDEALAIEPAPGRDDLIGTANVRGRATEIVDIGRYLPRAHRAWARGQRLAGSSAAVLLVDANPFFRDLLAPVLRAGGHRVRLASGAAEALRILADDPVDALVIDLDRRRDGGLELLASIRSLPQMAGVSVVGLASDPDPDLAEWRRLGIGRILAKFDRTGLVAALAEQAVPGAEAMLEDAA